MSSNNIFATRALLQKNRRSSCSNSYGDSYCDRTNEEEACLIDNIDCNRENLSRLRAENNRLNRNLDHAVRINDEAARLASHHVNMADNYECAANEAARRADHARSYAATQNRAYDTAFADIEDGGISCSSSDDTATVHMKQGLHLQHKAATYAALAGQKLNSAKILSKRQAALTNAKATHHHATALAAASALQEETSGLKAYDRDCNNVAADNLLNRNTMGHNYNSGHNHYGSGYNDYGFGHNHYGSGCNNNPSYSSSCNNDVGSCDSYSSYSSAPSCSSPRIIGTRNLAEVHDNCGNRSYMDLGVTGREHCQDENEMAFQHKYETLKTSHLEGQIAHAKAELSRHQNSVARLNALRAINAQTEFTKHLSLARIHSLEGSNPTTLLAGINNIVSNLSDNAADVALGRENGVDVPIVGAASGNVTSGNVTSSSSGNCSCSDNNSYSSSSSSSSSITTCNPSCNGITTGTSNTNCNQCSVDTVCKKQVLNCGIEFNDNEFRFGPCATKIYNESTNPNYATNNATAPTSANTLSHLINVINYDLPASEPPSTIYYYLPKFTVSPTCANGKGFVLDGQIVYISNVGTTNVIIKPHPGDHINDGKNAQIQLPPGALMTNSLSNVMPQSGLMLIAQGNGTNGKWFTLSV